MTSLPLSASLLRRLGVLVVAAIALSRAPLLAHDMWIVPTTFSPEPGVDRWRPAQQTSLPDLFLAGDWTATGWPATMEGAVRSGYLAAEALLRSFGTPKTLLQPDLAPDGLIQMWLGNSHSART